MERFEKNDFEIDSKEKCKIILINSNKFIEILFNLVQAKKQQISIGFT